MIAELDLCVLVLSYAQSNTSGLANKPELNRR